MKFKSIIFNLSIAILLTSCAHQATQKWDVDLNKGIENINNQDRIKSSIADDSNIYITTYFSVKAYDKKTGEQKWIYEYNNQEPTIKLTNKLCLLTFKNSIVAVAKNSGKKKWEFGDNKQFVFGSNVTSENLLILANSNFIKLDFNGKHIASYSLDQILYKDYGYIKGITLEENNLFILHKKEADKVIKHSFNGIKWKCDSTFINFNNKNNEKINLFNDYLIIESEDATKIKYSFYNKKSSKSIRSLFELDAYYIKSKNEIIAASKNEIKLIDISTQTTKWSYQTDNRTIKDISHKNGKTFCLVENKLYLITPNGFEDFASFKRNPIKIIDLNESQIVIQFHRTMASFYIKTE